MSETEPPEEKSAEDEHDVAPADAGGANARNDEAADDTSLVRVALVIVGIAILAAFAWTWSPDDADQPGTGAPNGNGATGGDEPDAQRPPIVVNVFATLDDRFVSEPCNRIPGGGLSSVGAVKEMVDRFLPGNLSVFMGDLSQAPGPVGARNAQFHWTEIIPLTGIDIVAAGEGELGYGVDFVRRYLGAPGTFTVLCANAVDTNEQPILRGWSLTSVGGRNVLTVAVAGESVGYELIKRGSDVGILSPVEAAREALAAGIERAIDVESPAHTKLLLVHGTLDEAEAVLREVEGFDYAVAADGPVLPELEPRDVSGVPLYYAGRGMRFTWRLVIADKAASSHDALVRVGGAFIARGSRYEGGLVAIRRAMRQQVYEGIAMEDLRPVDPRGEYAGDAACAECHPAEAEAHAAGPHASAPAGFLGSDYAGSTGCLPCHVTGAFHRGGWMPGEGSPGMEGISCENCHGPGADHAASPQSDYGHMDLARCHQCHLPDRTPEFDARKSWDATGHGK